jgi:hypothetical protein
MKRISIAVALVLLNLVTVSHAFAGKVCSICLSEHEAQLDGGDENGPTNTDTTEPVLAADLEERKFVACKNNHFSHQECVTDAVTSWDDLKDLKNNGLPCATCEARIPFVEVMNVLDSAGQDLLEERIRKAEAPAANEVSEREIQKLGTGFEEAFDLFCPSEGCGTGLDKINGCNAATCSNGECQQTFCYLCLESQLDSTAAHAHAAQHSGGPWEMREGYLKRYHWLLARKQIGSLFRKKVDSAVRTAAIESRRKHLVENDMMPMPAGILVGDWLNEVRDSDLSEGKRIELLQNEAIYRRSANDAKAFELIRAELNRLGALVLVSLDIGDARGLPAHGQALVVAVAAPEVLPRAEEVPAAPLPPAIVPARNPEHQDYLMEAVRRGGFNAGVYGRLQIPQTPFRKTKKEIVDDYKRKFEELRRKRR